MLLAEYPISSPASLHFREKPLKHLSALHERFGFLIDQCDLLDQRGAEFVARLQQMTFASDAWQKMLDRRERHACGAEEFDSLDRLLFARPILPEAALSASRLEESFLFVVAQHANAHRASPG